MISLVCKTCGVGFLVKPHRLRRKYPAEFCGRPCFYAGRRNVGMTGKKHSAETLAKFVVRPDCVEGAIAA